MSADKLKRENDLLKQAIKTIYQVTDPVVNRLMMPDEPDEQYIHRVKEAVRLSREASFDVAIEIPEILMDLDREEQTA